MEEATTTTATTCPRTRPPLDPLAGHPPCRVVSWLKLHPDFASALARGRTEADTAAARSLYDRAVGFWYTENVPMRVKNVEYNPDTGKRVREWEEIVVTPVQKFVPGDVNALRMWLMNRQSSNWREQSESKNFLATFDVSRMTDDQLLRIASGENPMQVMMSTPAAAPAPAALQAGPPTGAPTVPAELLPDDGEDRIVTQ